MRRIPDEDVRVFREAMRDVRRLEVPGPPPSPPRPRPGARFSRAAREAILNEVHVSPHDPAAQGVGDELHFRRHGVRDDAYKRLCLGRIAVEAQIDLHGLRRHAAQDALRDFLADAISRGLRCVRVVHGKGLRSGPGGPVLKHVVGQWLRSMQSVVAFASARPADGGTGAVYVLLAAPARSLRRGPPP